MRYCLLALSLFCAQLAAETVITNQGVVVQGKVLRSTDTTVTIQIPLYGGITVRRDAIEKIYGPDVNIGQTEEQSAEKAIAEANRQKEAEREERQKVLALKDLTEDRLIPAPTTSSAKSEGTSPAPKKHEKQDAGPGKKPAEPATPKGGKKPADAPAKKAADATPPAKPAGLIQKAVEALKPAVVPAAPRVAPAAAPAVPAATPVAPVAPAAAPAVPAATPVAPVAPAAAPAAPVPAPVPAPAPAPKAQ